MSRRVVSSRVCTKWTLSVLVLVLSATLSHSLSDNTTSDVLKSSLASVTPAVVKERKAVVATPAPPAPTAGNAPPAATATSAPIAVPAVVSSSAREVNKHPSPLGESLQQVASQLSDTRVPPRLSAQLNKHKIHRHDDLESSHAGVAVPVSLDELETTPTPAAAAPTPPPAESSTSTKGISTWILLSNPAANATTTSTTMSSTEPNKLEETTKKQKPAVTKNKTKRPPVKASSKRPQPLIASVNKSDLVAGGSAINDNELNKLKDTVLSNVHKNKNTSTQKATTPLTTTTVAAAVVTTKKDDTKITTPATPVVKVVTKPTKKKNKTKTKVNLTTTTTTTTTEEPFISDSALLPMEAKEQEIELEISTPATSTKKPKRTSSKKKKNKTKKRKTTATKISEAASTDVKTTEVKKPAKTKTSKPAKKPDNPITTQIFSYLSREVMPSVGVGVIGLAGLMGLAGYFLYPFATPVRRTFEVEKKDDLYRHNAEEYASEGNGQAEEEMLGTVLAGMPAHSKHKLNPYIGQMSAIAANRYPAKKEQELKYRHGTAAAGYESPNYNMHYPQQKTGIAHAAVYPSHPAPAAPAESAGYGAPQYETRHKYVADTQYSYDTSAYTTHPASAAEPVYAAPQTEPSGTGQLTNEGANSIVYGVKLAPETDFKPVYPFEGHVLSYTTSNPMTYPSTSMYLGSNSEDTAEEGNYSEGGESSESADNKFVVGNVPMELVDSATPAIVPEHGPRNLSRRKRAASSRYQRSLIDRIEQILREVKEKNRDREMSNEIDEALGGKMTMESERFTTESPMETKTEDNSIPTYIYINRQMTSNNDESPESSSTTEFHFDMIENISTLPIDETPKEASSHSTGSTQDLDYTNIKYITESTHPESSTNIEENRSFSVDPFLFDEQKTEKSSSTTLSDELNEIDYTTRSYKTEETSSESSKTIITNTEQEETPSTFQQSTTNTEQSSSTSSQPESNETYSTTKKVEVSEANEKSDKSTVTPSDSSKRDKVTEHTNEDDETKQSTIAASQSSTSQSATSPLSSSTPVKSTTTDNSTDPAPRSVTSTPTSPTSTSSLPTKPASKPTTKPSTSTTPAPETGNMFFRLIRQLFEAKYQLGLNILRTTSESLNRYLDRIHGAPSPSGAHADSPNRQIKRKLKINNIEEDLI